MVFLAGGAGGGALALASEAAESAWPPAIRGTLTRSLEAAAAAAAEAMGWARGAGGRAIAGARTGTEACLPPMDSRGSDSRQVGTWVPLDDLSGGKCTMC